MPIFETTKQTPGGAFTAENCTLTGTGLGDGAIVQRINVSINRPINFVYEIGSGKQNVYYVGGRRQGQATFERIVGGSATFKAFVQNYGPLCAKGNPVDDITLTANGGCFFDAKAATSTPTVYTLMTPRLTTLGASVSAQDIVIMESVGMMFLDLEYSDGTK